MYRAAEFTVNAAAGNPTPRLTATSSAPMRRRPVSRVSAQYAKTSPTKTNGAATTGRCQRGSTSNCHHDGDATEVQYEQANT